MSRFSFPFCDWYPIWVVRPFLPKGGGSSRRTTPEGLNMVHPATSARDLVALVTYWLVASSGSWAETRGRAREDPRPPANAARHQTPMR
eukprot:1196225-Prorocentrum_minimum.AAC.4